MSFVNNAANITYGKAKIKQHRIKKYQKKVLRNKLIKKFDFSHFQVYLIESTNNA